MCAAVLVTQIVLSLGAVLWQLDARAKLYFCPVGLLVVTNISITSSLSNIDLHVYNIEVVDHR